MQVCPKTCDSRRAVCKEHLSLESFLVIQLRLLFSQRPDLQNTTKVLFGDLDAIISRPAVTLLKHCELARLGEDGIVQFEARSPDGTQLQSWVQVEWPCSCTFLVEVDVTQFPRAPQSSCAEQLRGRHAPKHDKGVTPPPGSGPKRNTSQVACGLEHRCRNSLTELVAPEISQVLKVTGMGFSVRSAVGLNPATNRQSSMRQLCYIKADLEQGART